MRKEKGQALLETALVIPVFLILFCAIVDFGRVLYASNHLNMLTQEAVRLTGLGKSDYEVRQFVNNNVVLNDKDAIVINITPDGFTRKSGDYATLKISYGVKFITPLINVFLPSPFVVSTQSTIRVE